MGVILYNMFRDSYDEILEQLADTRFGILAVMLVLGNGYYLIDGVVYKILFLKNGYALNYFRCIALSYMGVFFNATTFGIGIKPAQVVYLHKKGIDPGKGFGIVTMPYIFHKTVVVVYAIVMLLINDGFVLKYFSSTFGYIYLGVAVSILIILFLILLCSANWFHQFVFKLLDFFLKKGKAVYINEEIKRQINHLREATLTIIKKPKAWLLLGGINIVKMSFWYVIPLIAIYACGKTPGTITPSEAITVTALMQLLMGVIPTSGGVGSLEVVFSVLFAAVFGKILAGSSMILYRISTYYIPFLISVLIMAILGQDAKRKKFDSFS